MAGPLLITGFGPFPGMPRNPTMVLAARLAQDLRLKRHGIATALRLLPTEYAAVDATIPLMMAELSPRAILMFGVASKRKHVSVETRACNRLSILHPDAAGRRPVRAVLAPGKAFTLKGRADMAALASRMQQAGVHSRASISAGGYLCNYAYWRMLEATASDMPCVFIHIPQVRSTAGMARLVDAGMQAAMALVNARLRPVVARA